MKHLIYLFSGILFSVGLLLSGMADPLKVKTFLNLSSAQWSPALLFVLLSATIIYLVFFLFLKRRGKTLSGTVFQNPAPRPADKKLLLGSVIFGLGWGLSGLCPGPAIVQVAFLNFGTFAFLISMFFGFELQRRSA